MGSFSAKMRLSDVAYSTLGLDKLSDKETQTIAAPQVVSLLATILERLIKKNEKSLQSSRKKSSITITSFHGLRSPTLSVLQYLERISKYARCSPSCFVIAFIYIKRYIQRHNFLVTSLNVHRLLITCVVLAAKFIDDACFSNSHYAKIGGVSTKEMNNMEMEFLFSLDFRLHVTLDAFDQYCLQLAKEASGRFHIERSIWFCGGKGRWVSKDEKCK